MKKFVIEKDFWELFPEAQTYFTEQEFSQNPVIKVWREAFQKFKTKKGARSSIEALLKRAASGNLVGCINPLVDLYNATSLTFALPCGGEDIDRFLGDVRLTKALGDEPFVTLGSGESEPPYEGEIIYKDEAGAICRCWNWRESERTMLTEKTKNAFLCIELTDPSRIEALKQALKSLAQTAEADLGGTWETFILEASNPELVIWE